MNDRPGILIIDRDAIAAQALKQPLQAQGQAVHHVVSCAHADEMMQQLAVKPGAAAVGVALIDQDTAGQGLESMRTLTDEWTGVVPIVTSAFRKVESAVQAMRLGAADYLLKPIIEAELLDAVQRAMQRHLFMIEREMAQQDVGRPVESVNARYAGEDAEDGYRPMPLSEAMKAPERQILLAALQANGWNRGRTAEQLDINRTTLYKKIRQHRLDEPA